MSDLPPVPLLPQSLDDSRARPPYPLSSILPNFSPAAFGLVVVMETEMKYTPIFRDFQPEQISDQQRAICCRGTS